ncbi:isoprenylcysteine carboxylmethyltransferase family protein [Geomonas sp. Red875]|uniref:Isoprenylcysteine carboxylmethyltransferase family protein n=2 Tax=Geomesophilobacter sediminis TaxID=2798584 RepID=A0A8J7JDC0_9BACT|nr:isoprenylcysteine carboxylmethyltransferase family protein [Geomesophilobacter sediminis]
MQFLLLLLLFFAPRETASIPLWSERWKAASLVVAGLLIGVGLTFGISAALRLGRNLTPLPRPKESGKLVETGPYGLVRHPIYTGVICMAYGWSVLAMSWLTIGYATVIFVFLDIKSRREERWLVEQYPGYEEYRKRVRRLIPFVY